MDRRRLWHGLSHMPSAVPVGDSCAGELRRGCLCWKVFDDVEI